MNTKHGSFRIDTHRVTRGCNGDCDQGRRDCLCQYEEGDPARPLEMLAWAIVLTLAIAACVVFPGVWW